MNNLTPKELQLLKIIITSFEQIFIPKLEKLKKELKNELFKFYNELD